MRVCGMCLILVHGGHYDPAKGKHTMVRVHCVFTVDDFSSFVLALYVEDYGVFVHGCCCTSFLCVF